MALLLAGEKKDVTAADSESTPPPPPPPTPPPAATPPENNNNNNDNNDNNDNLAKMDSGYVAWLQVLASWILFMNTWGLTNSYGVFQTYYVEVLLPHSSSSAIAWIGSIQLFLTMIVGIFAGWLLDAGHLHLLLLSGTFLEVFGLMMTSLSTEYWQILLSQAVCTGLGSGLLGLTSVAVIPLYFSSRRMMATGIAATGSSLAGIVYPIMLQNLFRTVGFAWAVRILAFLMLACLLVCCAVMRLRPRAVLKRKPLSFRVFRDLEYSLFVIAFALMILSVYVPFFYMEHYAIELGISSSMAFYLLSIMNATSLFGRLAPNWLADRYGGITVMIPSCFFSAIILFFMRYAHDLPGLIAISAIYGFVSGGMVSLPPAIIANLTKDPTDFGVRMGVGYTVAAFGALVGNPIAGALRVAAPRRSGHAGIRAVQKEFQFSWIFAGCIMMFCTVLLIVVEIHQKKKKKKEEEEEEKIVRGGNPIV